MATAVNPLRVDGRSSAANVEVCGWGHPPLSNHHAVRSAASPGRRCTTTISNAVPRDRTPARVRSVPRGRTRASTALRHLPSMQHHHRRERGPFGFSRWGRGKKRLRRSERAQRSSRVSAISEGTPQPAGAPLPPPPHHPPPNTQSRARKSGASIDQCSICSMLWRRKVMPTGGAYGRHLSRHIRRHQCRHHRLVDLNGRESG